MNNDEFERFVQKFGKDILRFCRMTAGDAEYGDELYQDTMLKLLEKKKRLDSMQNTKSYALSTSIYLWKNRKKKYANRMRLVPIDSMDEMSDEGYEFSDHDEEVSPEHIVLKQNEIDMVQGIVKALPEKYRYQSICIIRQICRSMRYPGFLDCRRGPSKAGCGKQRNS